MIDQSETKASDSYHYDQAFMRWTATNQESAKVIVPLVLSFWPAKTVVDFGCAMGNWLAVWAGHGLEITGVDGDYINPDHLMIDKKFFIQKNLNQPQDLGKRFDLVQSLEVAEHLDPEVAEQFIATLTAHGDAVLFSASPPGQGGEHHVNEQPFSYWRDLFAKFDYQLFDCLRPALINNRTIKSWYRYNTLFFVHSSRIDSLPETVRKHMVAPTDPVMDPAPWYYRLRRLLVQAMPASMVDLIARFLASMAVPPPKN